MRGRFEIWIILQSWNDEEIPQMSALVTHKISRPSAPLQRPPGNEVEVAIAIVSNGSLFKYFQSSRRAYCKKNRKLQVFFFWKTKIQFQFELKISFLIGLKKMSLPCEKSTCGVNFCMISEVHQIIINVGVDWLAGYILNELRLSAF